VPNDHFREKVEALYEGSTGKQIYVYAITFPGATNLNVRPSSRCGVLGMANGRHDVPGISTAIVQRIAKHLD
jgi:hypothetical protein